MLLSGRAIHRWLIWGHTSTLLIGTSKKNTQLCAKILQMVLTQKENKDKDKACFINKNPLCVDDFLAKKREEMSRPQPLLGQWQAPTAEVSVHPPESQGKGVTEPQRASPSCRAEERCSVNGFSDFLNPRTWSIHCFLLDGRNPMSDLEAT